MSEARGCDGGRYTTALLLRTYILGLMTWTLGCFWIVVYCVHYCINLDEVGDTPLRCGFCTST